MASVNPNGDEKYWLNGTTAEGVSNGVIDEGTQKFWLNGMAGEFLFPPSNIQSSFFLMYD